jgi:LmbE family N-acetylglucosaminyl deacetylase
VQLDLPVPASALAIGAHPDDVEFGSGATLAKWAAAGCVVSHLICTDGSKGSWDPSEDVAELVAMRQVEQRAAAAALGAAGDCVFLGAVDGELVAGLDERERVAREIRRLQPEVLLAHDPWKRWRLHPDHRAAGFLALDALVAARDPHFYPEQGLAPHRPTTLLLWEADEVDHVEDVTGFAERKVAALLEHRSQFRSTHDIDDPGDTAQVERFSRRVEDRLAEVGRTAGVAAGEGFKRVDRL